MVITNQKRIKHGENLVEYKSTSSLPLHADEQGIRRNKLSQMVGTAHLAQNYDILR
jgi:hypothetical protein